MSYAQGAAFLAPVQLKPGSSASPTHVKQVPPDWSTGAVDQDTANCSMATKLMALKLMGLVVPEAGLGDVLDKVYEGGRDPDVERPDAIVYGKLSYRQVSAKLVAAFNAAAPADRGEHALERIPGFTSHEEGWWQVGEEQASMVIGMRYDDPATPGIDHNEWPLRPVRLRANREASPTLHGWVAPSLGGKAWDFHPTFKKDTNLSREKMRSVRIVGKENPSKDLRTLLAALARAGMTTDRYDPDHRYRLRVEMEPVAGEVYLVGSEHHWVALESSGPAADGKIVPGDTYDPLDDEPRSGVGQPAPRIPTQIYYRIE